jgi:hypothetical protein
MRINIAIKIIVTTIIGLIISFGAFKMTPPQWEAIGIIQLGTRANSDEDIEDARAAIQRIKSPQNIRQVLNTFGIPSSEENVLMLLKNTRFIILGNSIEVHVMANSRDSAIKIGDIVGQTLINQHRMIVDTDNNKIKMKLLKKFKDKDNQDLTAMYVEAKETFISVPFDALESSIYPNQKIFLLIGAILGAMFGYLLTFYRKNEG